MKKEINRCDQCNKIIKNDNIYSEIQLIYKGNMLDFCDAVCLMEYTQNKDNFEKLEKDSKELLL